MKKILLFMVMVVGLSVAVLAQMKPISGKVTDKDGKPVSGASVKVKGHTGGVSSDSEGKFEINAKPGDVVVATAVGFESSQVKISTGGTIGLTLSSKTAELDEVIVTALGIKRSKNELSYAAQQISGTAVNGNRSANFVGNLAGQASGLSISQNNGLGASTNVVIRGSKSIIGSNQALFVVDGVPIDNSNTNTTDQKTSRGGYDYGNAANDINPDDIESISVLKGAASTALYGARGSNGVILIVTKKGTKGKKGLGITVNTGVTVGKINKSTFAEYQKKYGGGYGYYYEDTSGHFLYRDPNGFAPLDPSTQLNGVLVVPTSEDASYGAAFDPKLQVYQWDAFDPTSKNYLKARPWVAAANDPTTFFEKAVSTNTSIALDGSSASGWYKLGYTRTVDEGILPNSNIKKNLLNFGASYEIADNLTATANISYSNINGLGRYGTGYDGDYTKNPATNFRQWWQVNVDIKDLKDAYFRSKKNTTWNWSDPTNLTPIYWNNPYFDRYESYETDTRNRYIGNVSLNYKINKWASLLGRVSIDNYSEVQEERYALGSVGVSGYRKYLRTYLEYNYDILLNLEHQLSSSFNIRGTIGSNIRRTTTSDMRGNTNGGLAVPNLYSLANSINGIESPIEKMSNFGVDGYFATGTLGFKQSVFLDASIRTDKSSTLPTSTNQYYYPSASISWIFTKQLHVDFISFGKIRTNYAEVGAGAEFASLLNYYDVNTSFNGTAMTSAKLTKNNPDLKPEITKSSEVGIDMSFLNSRIGFDLTYYSTKTTDQNIAASVSRATGYNSKYINAGTVTNKGIELTVNGTPIATPSFNWTVNVNWTKNTSKVEDLGGSIQNIQLASLNGGVSINAAVGEAYGTIKGSNFVYLNGQPIVSSNGRYKISSTSDQIIGNINPDWYGSLRNSFKYKNVALSFLIDTKQGGDVFSLDMYYGLATGLYPETAGLNDKGNPLRNSIANGGGIIRSGVDANGKPNTVRVQAVNYGAYGYRYSPAAAFVYDASYIKLREVAITYSIPSKILALTHFLKGADFSIIGRNLWIEKKLPYADPEDGMSSGNIQGYQVGSYPSTRSFGANLKLKF